MILQPTDDARVALDAQINTVQEQVKIAEERFKQEMEKLQESKSMLRTARNRLSIISKLPVELLSLIFKYVVCPQPQVGFNGRLDEEDPFLNVRWRHIVRLMCICRSWRSVALQCPSFWSRVVFSRNPAIVDAMLERSRSSPLYIRISEYHSYMPPETAVPQRIRDIAHMRELHLHLRPHKLDVFLANITCSSAEDLQSLCIHNYNKKPNNSDQRAEWALYTMPPELFRVSMPDLRHLDIRDCQIPWDSFRIAATSTFWRLISLKLVRIAWSPSGPSQFYSFFSGMPNLEALHLEAALPEHSPDVEPGNQIENASANPSKLPRISSCTILSSSLAQCEEFHSNVSYPIETASLHFLPIGTPLRSSSDEETALALMLSRCGLSDTSPRRSHSNLLMMPSQDSPGIKMILWDGGLDSLPHSLHIFDWNRTPSVIIDLTHTQSSKLGIPLLHHLSVPELRTIGIYQTIPCKYNTQEWRIFFGRHPSVTHLHIRSSFALDIISAISTPRILEENLQPEELLMQPPESSLCLPGLVKLTLEDHGAEFVSNLKNDRFNLASLPINAQAGLWSAVIYHELCVARMQEEINGIVESMFRRCDYYAPLQELHLFFARGWDIDSFKLLSEAAVTTTCANPGGLHPCGEEYYEYPEEYQRELEDTRQRQLEREAQGKGDDSEWTGSESESDELEDESDASAVSEIYF